jgi:hypothetical protein
MIEDIIDYEPYILNDNNMSLYLKYKLNNPLNKYPQEINKSINKEINNPINKEINNPINKEINKPINKDIFFPKEQDSLFWCYYIISSGECNYEMINVKNSLVAKGFKINYIYNKIRTNKQLVKTYKFDTITNIESNLAYDNNINIKTVMSLCVIDKINLIFVSKNTYYELQMNDNEEIYIIRELGNYSKKYGFEIANSNLLEEIRRTLYNIEILDKPIKSLASYKVKDLTDICNKLAIEIKNITGKNKTKNELYESLIQYFN